MISYRLTPWDEKSLRMKTAELTVDKELVNFEEEFLSLEKKLKEEGVQFIYTRISSENFALRNAIQQAGFYFAECSQTVERNKIHKFEKERFPSLAFELLEEKRLSEIKELAKKSFDFSRFHEDVKIPIEFSRERYFNWIDDLVSQNATIHQATVGDKLVGISIQKEDMDKKQSDLILAGCAKGNELYVMSLWNEILQYNKEQGIRKMKTLISASNVGVVNVYAHFGFKFKQTLLGFHKKI